MFYISHFEFSTVHVLKITCVAHQKLSSLIISVSFQSFDALVGTFIRDSATLVACQLRWDLPELSWWTWQILHYKLPN